MKLMPYSQQKNFSIYQLLRLMTKYIQKYQSIFAFLNSIVQQQTRMARAREVVVFYAAVLGATIRTSVEHRTAAITLFLSTIAASVFAWPGTNPWSLLPFSCRVGCGVPRREAPKFFLGNTNLFFLRIMPTPNFLYN